MSALPAPHVFLWQGPLGEWGPGRGTWRCPAFLLTEPLHGRLHVVPPSTGMTHEDIVQESKKYWQQTEAHAGKASSSLVRPWVGAGRGVASGP